MPKQRNNVARLPFDARKRVCELIFDAATYDDIRQTVADEFNIDLVLHNSSLLAYQESEEYRNYCSSRQEWDKQLQPKRWAASLINDGKGLESAADMAAMELLEQIQSLSGSEMPVSDAHKLASAVVSLKRVAVASKEQALRDEFASKEASLKEEIAQLKKQIESLTASKDKSSRGGLSPEALKAIEEQAGIM